MGKINNRENLLNKLSKTKKYGLILILFGLIAGGILKLRTDKESFITQLERQEYGQGDEKIFLNIKSDYGVDELDLDIAEKRYSEEEIKELFDKFLEELPVLLQGDNTSLNEVYSNLQFNDSFDEFPFSCEYISDNPEVLGSDGEIKKDVPEETIIKISMDISYESFNADHSFYVVIKPRILSKREQFIKQLKDALIEEELITREEEYISLPDNIDGQKVFYSAPKENKASLIIILSIVIGVLLFFVDNSVQKENQKKKLQSIKDEYPLFARKFSMLSGAGISPRQIFIKLGETYYNSKKHDMPLYDEIVITIKEMSKGIPEIKAYENFAKRCEVREISVFTTVLIQNLRKGSVSLNLEMKKLSDEALMNQKGEIRRKGELAGSKLLFPMLIFLVIVFVMIMVPAFLSFSSFG